MRILDINHHYQYVNISKTEKFAFLLIQKCATQSILENQSLKISRKKKKFIKYYNKPVFCCIRNPIDRFISAIPQILLYYSLDKRDHLVVNKDIYLILNDMLKFISKPEIFLDKFIELIDIYNFDTHTQPIYNYITDKNNNLISNLNLFTLENFDKSISLICNNFKLNNTEFNKKNSSIIKFSYKKNYYFTFKIILKNFLKKYGWINTNFYYPVTNVYTKNKNELFVAYQQWKEIVKKEKFKNKLSLIYKNDLIIYENISKSKNLIINLNNKKFQKFFKI